MNKQSLNEYIFAAQRGDREALVELLTYSWGIVSYQCGKLLPSRQSGEKMTTVVLKTLAEKLDSLKEPSQYFNWLGRITAVRCMRVRATLLENGQGEESTENRNFSFPSMELNKAETAQVAVMLTDMLEDRPRLSLYLYSLSGLTPKAISQLTGVTEETVQKDICQGQQAVQKQMSRYAAQGVHFTQADSLPALLRTDMLLNQDPERATALVYSILGSLTLPAAPKRPAKPQAQPRAPQQPQQSRPARQQPPKAQNAKRKSEAGLIRALAIVAGILAVILLVSLVVLFTKNKNQTDSLSVPASASCVLLRQENAPTGLWERQL